MVCCILCGEQSSQASTSFRGKEERSKLSVVQFVVRIFLELEISTCRRLIDELCDDWNTCEACSEVIQESFEIYRQFVKLTDKFRKNRKQIAEKCKKLKNLDYGGGRNKATIKTFHQAIINASDDYSATFLLVDPETFLKEVVKLDDVRRQVVSSDVEEEVETADENPNQKNVISPDPAESSKPEVRNGEQKDETRSGSHTNHQGQITVKEEVDLQVDSNSTDYEKDAEMETGSDNDCSQDDEDEGTVREADTDQDTSNLEPSSKHVLEEMEGSSSQKSRKKRQPILRYLKEEEEIPPHPVTNRYNCPQCAYSGSKKSLLRRHFRDIHLGNNPNSFFKKYLTKPRGIHHLEQDKSVRFCKVGVRKTKRPKKEPPKKELKRVPKFFSLSELKKDAVTKMLKCPECDYSNQRIERLRCHYARVHSNEVSDQKMYSYSCTWPGCGRIIFNKENFRYHMDKHNGTPRLKCDQCSSSFYRHNALYLHRQLKHDVRKKDVLGGCQTRKRKDVICKHCGETVKHGSITGHRRKVHGIGKLNDSADKQKMQKQTKMCELCGKNIKIGSITYHRRKVHGIGKLTDSVDKHEDHKICELCGKMLLSRDSLKLHMWNIHRDENFSVGILKCPECGNGFCAKEFLDIHLYSKHKIGDASVYAKKKSKQAWQCDVQGCRKKFYLEENYKSHMEEIHGPDKKKPAPFACKFCGKRFFIQFKHEFHEQSHENSETKPFACDTCGKGFPTQAYLRYHLVRTHKIQLENKQGFRHLKNKHVYTPLN